jgi:hypothetical protein
MAVRSVDPIHELRPIGTSDGLRPHQIVDGGEIGERATRVVVSYLSSVQPSVKPEDGGLGRARMAAGAETRR